ATAAGSIRSCSISRRSSRSDLQLQQSSCPPALLNIPGENLVQYLIQLTNCGCVKIVSSSKLFKPQLLDQSLH
ncbi:unnamed protein product, partial [Musa banksii]